MTALGKILVVVNFVFTLVTGALILLVFSVRTNWKTSYDRLSNYYQVSQANVRTQAEEVKLTKSKAQEDADKLNGQIAKLTNDNKRLDDNNKTLTATIIKERENAANAGRATGTSTAELLRLRDELKEANEKVTAREKQMLELVLKNKDLLDKAVRNEIAARSSNERAQRLVEQLESTSRDLERIKAGPSTTASGAVIRRPPPEDVEGVIMDTDPKSGLVTVSIGSDAGITKGNTLEVYRLKPEPKYLGTIRILEVNAHEAVGRPTAAQKAGMLQKGDRVASSILGQR